MTQAERRLYLIRSLLNEKTEYQSLNVPRDAGEQRFCYGVYCIYRFCQSFCNRRRSRLVDTCFLYALNSYICSNCSISCK